MSGFGSNSGFGQLGTQSNTFGNSGQTQQQPASGFGFGAKRTQSFGGPGSSSGLFGASTSTQPQTTSLFGSNTSTTQPSTGLFGNSAGANTGATTTGSTTGGTTGGTGLFGNTNSSFGNNTNTGSTSLFGSKPANSGGLFGSTNTSGGLFGNKPAAPTTGSGLFGSTNNSTGTGGGLFGANSSTTNSGGLFGNSSKPLFGSQPLFGGAQTGAQTGAQNGTQGTQVGTQTGTQPGGLFSKPSIFGQPAQQQPQQPQQQQPQLIASIDQASFTLSGVSPSQKLYSSLSTVGSKRPASELDHAPPPLEFKYPATRRSLPGSASIARTFDGGSGFQAPTPQGEPRKWINSYDKFVREQPTTLIISAKSREPPVALLESAPVAAEPPTLASLNGAAHDTQRETTTSASAAGAAPAAAPVGDVSLFHRQANNMTLVRVNKLAIEEGYYISPRLEDLASMSKSQLAAVNHLVIGRDNYGQIEYPDPVDLSQIENLGDLLGELVVFESGTVCVYPDESTKAPPGRELNKPCTVSIENAWPKDASTHAVIRDMDDARMTKHIQRLRQACESQGGEFVTFAHGTWVFKVPHFSTWGIPADEMVVDDEPFIEVPSRETSRETSRQASVEPREPSREPSREPRDPSVGPVGDLMLDPEVDPEDQPQTWREQLVHASNGILLAAAGALTAASEPTASLNLEQMLRGEPSSGGVGSATATTTNETEEEDFAPGSLKLSAVREKLNTRSRADSELPLLSLNLGFAQLGQFSPAHTELWDLLSILFDSSSSAADPRERICDWLDRKNKADVNFQGDALDTIWELVSRHRLQEAAHRATTSNNLHLAALIAMMGGDRDALRALAAAAESQLNDWTTTRAVPHIPVPVRRIWELAAGRVPSNAGFSWPQWIGASLWYSSDRTVKAAVQSLPPSIGTTTTTTKNGDASLVFLEYFAGRKQLRTAVSELGLVDAYLVLQAMAHTQPAVVKADLKFYDQVCLKLSEAFDRSGGDHAAMAVFAALNITDSKLATKTMRSILNRAPATIILPRDFGVPEPFLDESRAFQVAKEGEFRAQAEYLLRAGLYNDAHRVVVATVGPEAVLVKTPELVLGVLTELEQHKSEIKRWEFGGKVFLSYFRLTTASNTTNPEQYPVVELCNALRYADTPTLKSREAVSRIAEWVASTTYAKSTLSSQMILKMKFDPSQARIQTLQEASRLLH